MRLTFVQGITIAIAAALGLGALVQNIGSDLRHADPVDFETVYNALTFDDSGGLTFNTTQEFRELTQAAPQFWFYAESENGGFLAFGNVPAAYQGFQGYLSSLAGTNIRGYGEGHDLDAYVRVFDGQDQPRVHILSGNGRLIDVIPAAMQTINSYLVGLFAAIAVATGLAIAWIIRREFKSIEAIAEQADAINIDVRGIRLPENKLPKEIRPLIMAINAALGRIDVGYIRQQRFLAAAAHELKTPIAIIQTRIETTLEEPAKGPLMRDAARLQNLAEQLLDVQRLEHAADVDEATDLVDAIRTTVGNLAPMAIAAGYDISFSAELEHHIVSADHGAIERVATNLIQNAIVHGTRGGTIEVTVESDGQLCVYDDGPGIADEHKSEIFEPFYRVTPSNRGSGLGLSLVSGVIRILRGRVTVADRPGGGTTFKVLFPASRKTSD